MRSSAKVWRARLTYRSLPYKVMLLSVVIGMALLIWLVMKPIAIQSWHSIGPKLPIGASSRTSVLVETEHLTRSEIKQLHEQVQRVVVYQTRPRLELVGLGQRLRFQEDGQTLLEIGLLPHRAQELLKSDTLMELKMSAPSMILLLQDLMYSSRGQKIKSTLDRLRNRISQSWQRLWPPIEKTLVNRLPPDLFQRIIHDDFIMGRLQSALATQVRAQVNFEQVGHKLKNSPALQSLLRLTTDQLDYLGIGEEVIAGSWRATSPAWNQLKQSLKPQWGSAELIWDGARCTGQVVSSTSTVATNVLRILIGKSKSKVCEQLHGSMRHVALAGAKEGTQRILGHAWTQVKRERRKAIKLGKQLGKQAFKEMKTVTVLEEFGRAIHSDEGLRTYVKKAYGSEAWVTLKKALNDIGRLPQLKNELDDLSHHTMLLAKKAFGALILDEEGQGPNPILLTMIREQLDGQRRPTVWVTPGRSDMAVNPGHFFSRSDSLNNGRYQ